jgi:SWI/SNF-related matrix-associated actin-dependent regulator of chromatin subfamily A member 5
MFGCYIDHARFISKIEQAEAKRKKADRTEELLKEKISSVKMPMQNLKIHYVNQTKGKSYSEEEDRFLLVQLHRHGLGKEEVYDLIKKDIIESPLFRSVDKKHFIPLFVHILKEYRQC